MAEPYNQNQVCPSYEASKLLQESESYRMQHQYDHAIACSEAAVTLLRQNIPGTEYDALDELGLAFMQVGKLEAAIPCFREASEIVSHEFYNNHPRMVSALDHWCQASVIAGDLVMAEQLCKRSLSIKQQSHHPQDIHTLEAMRVLGEIQRKLGKYQDAKATLKKAIAAMKESTIGPIEEFLYELGLVYLNQDRKEEAESTLFEALKIFSGRLGKHRRFAMCIDAYAEVVKLFGLREDALRLLERSEHMKATSTLNTSIENTPGSLFFEHGLYPTTILH